MKGRWSNVPFHSHWNWARNAFQSAEEKSSFDSKPGKIPKTWTCQKFRKYDLKNFFLKNCKIWKFKMKCWNSRWKKAFGKIKIQKKKLFSQNLQCSRIPRLKIIHFNSKIIWKNFKTPKWNSRTSDKKNKKKRMKIWDLKNKWKTKKNIVLFFFWKMIIFRN